MSKKIAIIALIAGCVFAASAPAEAKKIMTWTYTGQVSYLQNPTGVFANVALGDPWTAQYVFDPTKGIHLVGSTYEGIIGGPAAYPGTSSPVISATLKIGSASLSVPGAYHGYATIFDEGPNNGAYAVAQDLEGPGVRFFTNGSSAAPGVFPVAFPYSFEGPYGVLGQLGLSDGHGNTIELIQASLNYVTLKTVVPEPLTLSMFGAGVCGLAALRRRKKKLA